MQLIFERGERHSPVGHALIYFRGEDGSILATYVSVPPFSFDFAKFIPPFLANALEGMDLSGGTAVAAIPPIPDEVPSVEYLQALAERRQDDLIFAGGTMKSDQLRLGAETHEAAQEYADLYQSTVETPVTAPTIEPDTSGFADMSEGEQLNELTRLTGRLRDSIASGVPDESIERQMRVLAGLLPTKYRAERLVDVARSPGDRSQRLAELYLERSYKLFNEDYLDLERIDREIDALAE